MKLSALKSGFLTKPVLACFLAMTWPVALVHAESAECLKQVFGSYCLGASFSQTVHAATPPPLFTQKQGEGEAAVFSGLRGRRYVMAYRQRIYKVVKEERPSTQLHFDEMSRFLSEKYGQAEDASRFPEHVVRPASRVVAIRRGEGRAVRIWRPDQAWRVELSWSREMGVALSYIANELDAQRRQDLEQGL